ncbi:MAG TPA: WYL domain-containing protein [Streptosporangiaceae bacterium]|nr:WYL domain-containing protein [Streptosporangiaceae bacterium]
MRAERLLRILILLQAYESVTASELARSLEVSARTIQRDLDSLSLAGVPVYASRGRGGGWRLARDYRTRLNGLTPAEAVTMFVGTTAHVLADLGLDAAASSAFAKLLSALPANARKDAEYARARVLVDHAGWQGAGEASPHLALLRRALWEERRVQVCYGGQQVGLDPLGLVAKGTTWYLIAARDDGEIRTYRVPKITSAALAEQTFERPRGFDLAAHWAGACDRFFAARPVYPVQLRVRTPAVHRLSWAPGTTITAVAECADGWSDVTMTFENAFEAATFLLGMAGDAVALAPGELRERIRTAAGRLARLHGAR